MWSEITLQGIVARDATTISNLTKLAAAQRLMNAVYNRNYTLADLGKMFSRKERLKIKAWYYDDGTTIATLVTKLNGMGDMRLLTTACGAGDPELAADIVQDKLKSVMPLYSATSCYALWGADNYEAGNIYFSKFVERAKTAFSSAVNEEYFPGAYKLTMLL